MPYISESQEFYMMLTFSILTIIFSIPVIIIILKQKLYTSYAFRILLYLAINDLYKSILGFFPPKSIKDSTCNFIAITNYFVNLSNISWAGCLNMIIFQIIVLEQSNFEKYQRLWFMCSYCIPALLSTLPLITDSYGYSEGFCELKMNETGNIWRFSIFYIPVTVNLVVTAVLFAKVYRKVGMIGSENMKFVVFERGFIYSLIISCVILPFEIVRIIQLFMNSLELDTAALIGYCISLLHGFSNSIVFFANKTVRSTLTEKKTSETKKKTMSESNSSLLISIRSL